MKASDIQQRLNAAKDKMPEGVFEPAIDVINLIIDTEMKEVTQALDRQGREFSQSLAGLRSDIKLQSAESSLVDKRITSLGNIIMIGFGALAIVIAILAVVLVVK